MIRKPHNWNEVQEFSDRPKLPLGAYVCRVLKATIQPTDYGDQLCIGFDISEGEYNGFFRKDFDANTNKDKKWRGVLRQWLPKDDGSEKDETTKRAFKGFVTSFERSNNGYQFDWNEASLVGKSVGIMFRNEEWEYNNKTGWAVRPFRAMSVDTVRSGNYTLPNDKPLNKPTASSPYIPSAEPGYTSGSREDFMEVPGDDLLF